MYVITVDLHQKDVVEIVYSARFILAENAAEALEKWNVKFPEKKLKTAEYLVLRRAEVSTALLRKHYFCRAW